MRGVRSSATKWVLARHQWHCPSVPIFQPKVRLSPTLLNLMAREMRETRDILRKSPEETNSRSDIRRQSALYRISPGIEKNGITYCIILVYTHCSDAPNFYCTSVFGRPDRGRTFERMARILIVALSHACRSKRLALTQISFD